MRPTVEVPVANVGGLSVMTVDEYETVVELNSGLTELDVNVKVTTCEASVLLWGVRAVVVKASVVGGCVAKACVVRASVVRTSVVPLCVLLSVALRVTLCMVVPWGVGGVGQMVTSDTVTVVKRGVGVVRAELNVEGG
jgi:hypothetical protein